MAQLSRARIGGYFARGDSAHTTKEKGDALEDLIVYLFEQVPGMTALSRNQRNPFGTEEIDIAFWNDRLPAGLYFLPDTVLVECKNWSHPVDYNTLVGFDAKLRSRAQPLGILVAASGITGNPTFSSDAYSVVTNALAQQRRLIVITRAEIEAMTQTADIVLLFKTKLCQLAATGTIVL